MKHAMIPTTNPMQGVDRNNPEKARTAIALEWPNTFSKRAKMVIRCLEGTIFPFSYDNHIVVTDDSLELTVFDNGASPIYEDNTLEGVEAWFEEIADQYDADGDVDGWEEAKASVETEEWAKKHIRTLASHGAKLVINGDPVSFDESIWDKAMAECRQEGYQAIMYSMQIPETTEPMGLCIWRDGHVSSGSEKTVIDCMAQF